MFSNTVGLVRPKTKDKWLKVSHDAGNALIHDVVVHLYRLDCYATSHCKYGNLASNENPCVVRVAPLSR